MDMLLFLASVLEPMNLFAILVGVVCGLLIGGLPGLTANLGVALLLPVTYSLDVTAALLMLMSLYTSAIYGGVFRGDSFSAPREPLPQPQLRLTVFNSPARGEFDKAIRIATFFLRCGGAGKRVRAFDYCATLVAAVAEIRPRGIFHAGGIWLDDYRHIVLRQHCERASVRSARSVHQRDRA